MTVPNCPRCDGPVEKIRADARGLVWTRCYACRKSILFDADGRPVYVSAD